MPYCNVDFKIASKIPFIMEIFLFKVKIVKLKFK